MKYYYATGSNGSYLHLEDGRYADTVGGDTSEQVDAHIALELLNDETETMQASRTPLFGDFDANQMDDYVGA